MNTKPKIILLTSAIVLGALSVVASANAIAKDGLPVSASTSRTLTVNKGNRDIGPKIEGVTYLEFVTYELNTSGAYAYIRTSDSQQSVFEGGDNAVFVTWCRPNAFFYINNKGYTDKEFVVGEKSFYTVQYNHLTSIDFVLDKGNETSSDRILELQASSGTITKTGESPYEEDNCIYYTWTADGFISIDDDLEFEPKSGTAGSGKAIWMRSMTFHYDC